MLRLKEPHGAEGLVLKPQTRGSGNRAQHVDDWRTIYTVGKPAQVYLETQNRGTGESVVFLTLTSLVPRIVAPVLA